MFKNNSYLATLVILALVGCSLASIESSPPTPNPVRVTLKNSGPSYDIDNDNEVERTRDFPTSNREIQEEKSESNNNEPTGETPAVGHISIRRIFLVPIMPQNQGPSEQPMWSRPSSRPESENGEMPSLFSGPLRPFWPVRHHLLGQDEASRNPTSEASDDKPVVSTNHRDQEDDESIQEHPRPMIDPFAMMLGMIQEALNNQPTRDMLEKGASEAGPVDADKKAPEVEQPAKPSSANETKEDIVEIEGKKYLRKTVINRHVGPNMVFMTRRLIFTPLNETEPSAPTTTTTTTTVPPTSGATAEVSSTTTNKSDVEPEFERKQEEQPVTSSSTTTETPIEASTLAAKEAEQPVKPENATTSSSKDDAITEGPKATLSERITSAIEKVVEKAESYITTTEKPKAASSDDNNSRV